MTKLRHQKDRTLEMNTLQRWRYLIREYELTKAKKHHSYRYVNDFYAAHGVTRQNFNKYYNRFKATMDSHALLPQKRGPRYKTRRIHPTIEHKVIQLRKEGLNRYEICNLLRPKLLNKTPSPSTVYQIFKRNNMNRLKAKMTQRKVRKIVKTRAGEMGHIDCHYLPKGLIQGDSTRYFLLGVMDGFTRLAWCELIDDVKSLTAMFAALKSFNLLNMDYGIQFEEVLTDNGSEFGGGPSKANLDTNPFERLLLEMGIKHRYTRPARPQTNGKIERFWRTLEDDLLEGVVFDSKEDLINEIQQYMLYYNEERPHQSLQGQTPAQFRRDHQS